MTFPTSNLFRVAGALLALALNQACAATTPSATVATPATLLARSTPAAGSIVAAPVNKLMLRFARPVRLGEVVVEGPDGLFPMMLTAAGEVADYLIPLPDLGPGSYTVRWKARVGGSNVAGSFAFAIRG